MRHFGLITLLSAILLAGTGCSQPAMVGIGAGIGAATLAGIEADLQKSKARVIAEKIALQGRADLSAEQIAQLTKALDKKQAKIEALQTGAGIAGQAARTNWTNPDQAAPWIMAAITSLLAYKKHREGKSLGGLLSDYQKAVNRYQAQADPDVASKLSAELPG